MGVGIGLMTIVGQCMGAGRKDEAVYFIKKVTLIAEVVVINQLSGCFCSCSAGDNAGRHGRRKRVNVYLYDHMDYNRKAIVWTLAFIPAYGIIDIRIDVRFSMVLSCLSMWFCRVVLCIVLIRIFHFGPIGVWIGMFADWTIRAVLFTVRFFSGKWAGIKV